MEETLQHKKKLSDSQLEMIKQGKMKPPISYRLTIKFGDDNREYEKLFNVEEKFLPNVWRICKYMVEK